MSLSNEARRIAGREATELLQNKDVLLQEMQHRVANSLQIIASILMLKARTVQSAEARLHLEDACHRILSVATVQRHIEIAAPGERIRLGPHLSRLCATLAASMIGDSRRTSLQVEADAGEVLPDDVMSIGLIVTELVINALKYAFSSGSEGKILVKYTVDGVNWRLSVCDNGIGMQKEYHAHTGIGTSIVEALAKQLEARVETRSNSHGTRVSVTHGMSDRGWSALHDMELHDMENWPPKSNGHSVG
jgi:two-component sensor histidine kinase